MYTINGYKGMVQKYSYVILDILMYILKICNMQSRKDYEKMAKIVIIIFFLQFFTGIHVEYFKFHNLDAGKTYQCF